MIQKVRLFLITIVLCPVYNFSFSQDSVKADSLTYALNETNDDSTKVEILLDLFWEYRRSNPEKAIKYSQQALEIAQTIEFTQGIGRALQNCGIIKKVQGNYDSAFRLMQESKIHFEQISDTIGIVSCLTDMSDIFSKQSNFQTALQNLDEARRLIIKKGNKEKLSRIYNKLGGIYNIQKQYEKALEYHQKSLEINQEMDFKLGMSVNYNNIGNVLIDLKKYDEATVNYLKSLEIKRTINDNFGIASSLNNLGLVFSHQKEFNKALEYHNMALDKFIELGDNQKVAMCNVNIANDYLEARDFQQAIDFATIGLNLSEEQNLKRNQTEAYRILAEAYAAEDKFKEAYFYQKLFKVYNDSIINVEAVRQITEMESEFEIEKKEKEIALLNAENERQELKMQKQRSQRNLLIGFIALAIGVLILLFWSYRNKQKLNKKLEELNLTKSRFFANISHEFRTPLTLLLGPLEKLMNTVKKEDKELIGMMHRNATRLLFLDNQLLDLSKLEAGKLSLKVSQSDIIQSLKGMVMSFQSLAEKKKIDFKFSFHKNEIQAYFDQEKLEKIVYNLLSNAMKFTPEKGKVVFELSFTSNQGKKELPQNIKRLSGQVICISVSDTGPGIEKENQSYIFDHFYQVDSKQNRKFEGTGLGLSLTKELVELHHGSIILNSEPGKGSTFKVYLPIEEQAYKSSEIVRDKGETMEGYPLEEHTFTDHKLSSGDLRKEEKLVGNDVVQLLLVEDNQDMRTYIRDCFSEGYNIHEAENGNLGFNAATEKIPDIIISDLMMPEMDGIELCNKLKQDERTSHIPVILLTALSSIEDRIRGLETGADDYIAKPFNRDELVTRINNLTEQRRKLRERFSKEIKIQPKDITVSSADEQFLDKLISFIETNIADPDLNVDSLTGQVHLSRSQLHRKLKALTNLSATEFIRNIRLKRAAQLLEQHHGTIAETVYAVGFNSLSYFSKCFQKQFNKTPKEYIEQF